jgi:hypothetical protein
MIIPGHWWDIVAFADEQGYDRLVVIHHFTPSTLTTPSHLLPRSRRHADPGVAAQRAILDRARASPSETASRLRQ